jgi:predicted outer membrane repeat protein
LYWYHIFPAEDVVIFFCLFVKGGAMYLDGCMLEARNTSFIESTSSEDGGAIYFAVGTVWVLININFDHNIASGGQGGAIMALAADLDMRSCSFTYNEAYYDGGAIALIGDYSLIEMYSSSVKHSISYYGNGGGLACTSGAVCEIWNGDIVNNTALLGGALAFDSPLTTWISYYTRVYNTTFVQNKGIIAANLVYMTFVTQSEWIGNTFESTEDDGGSSLIVMSDSWNTSMIDNRIDSSVTVIFLDTSNSDSVPQAAWAPDDIDNFGTGILYASSVTQLMITSSTLARAQLSGSPWSPSLSISYLDVFYNQPILPTLTVSVEALTTDVNLLGVTSYTRLFSDVDVTDPITFTSLGNNTLSSWRLDA